MKGSAKGMGIEVHACSPSWICIRSFPSPVCFPVSSVTRLLAYWEKRRGAKTLEEWCLSFGYKCNAQQTQPAHCMGGERMGQMFPKWAKAPALTTPPCVARSEAQWCLPWAPLTKPDIMGRMINNQQMLWRSSKQQNHLLRSKTIKNKQKCLKLYEQNVPSTVQHLLLYKQYQMLMLVAGCTAEWFCTRELPLSALTGAHSAARCCILRPA